MTLKKKKLQNFFFFIFTAAAANCWLSTFFSVYVFLLCSSDEHWVGECKAAAVLREFRQLTLIAASELPGISMVTPGFID